MLARSLSKDPGATCEALRRTLHGCEWMIARWALLAHAAETQAEGWSVEQTRLAFDLLGTPAVFREGKRPGVMLDDEGQVIDTGENPAEVARRQITLLKHQRDVVSDLDEVERSLAAVDLTNEGDAELRRLRRYETSLHTRLRWAINRHPDPSLRPNWTVDREPPPEPNAEPPLKPEPRMPEEIAVESWKPTDIHPPFDLEPDEIPPIGQDPDILAIVAQRRQKKLQKEETRRQKRREKIGKLRA
jgi:hypothetical protein